MAIEILSVSPSEMPGGGNLVYEYQGLKADTKPTVGVGSGSTFDELDGDFWRYSAEEDNANPATSNGWWN